MSSRTSGRIVGGLVLAAFLLYGGGSDGGALLMLMNSLAVAAIGVIALPVLQRTDPLAATGYLATRILEAALLAVGTILVLSPATEEGGQYAYWFAMITLGLGSLPFCRVLLRARLVPPPLAMWGLLGYACLAAGAMLEVVEVVGVGGGLLLTAPGGLFEVVFGVLLLVRGFPEPTAATGVPTTELAATNG